MRQLIEKEIVVASHNQGKISEIKTLVVPFGLEVRSATELNLPEPEETGKTFEANALEKARLAARATGLPALADDSGLCVEALDGAPGVLSARWAENRDNDRRDFSIAMNRIEKALWDKGATAPSCRRARFVAVLCLAWSDGHHAFFRGETEGQMVWPPRGNNGFGYDPVFMPDGFTQTFAQMPESQKHGWQVGRQEGNPLSHRARAFAKFVNECLRV